MSSTKPLWHGILLVSGGAIGGGMFALPTAASGAWMLWATFGFVLVWAMTYLAASIQAKVNIMLVQTPDSGLTTESSFNALVNFALGKHWALLNNLSIAFIMMILMYAYTTAGASIISYTLTNMDIAFDNDQRGWLSLLFALCVATVVSLGTTWVSRITLLLMIAMAVLFAMLAAGLLPNVQFSQFIEPVDTHPYLWAALPVIVTAFACGGLVPSLVRHYPNKQLNVFRSLFYGTLLALVVYLLWLAFTLGTIERSVFLQIGKEGGDIGSLVNALINSSSKESNYLQTIELNITLFSHFAIITSFLSVSLGFLHFLRDKLSLNAKRQKRILASIYCFLPPALASFFFPYGFVHAIGLAGLFVIFSFFILPSVMALKLRQKADGIILFASITSIVMFGVLVFVLKCLALLGMLPSAWL